MSEHALTVGTLRNMMSDLDDDAAVLVDVPVLAETHRASRINVEARAYQPDRLTIQGYTDD